MLEPSVHTEKLAFLASFFALVVFFVDGFFAAAVFLVAAGAFFGAVTGFFVVAVLFVVVLDLPRAAFFVGVVLATSVALGFLEGGWAFCHRLNNLPHKKGIGSQYLFGISSNLGAFRGKLDFARRTLREDKCIFLSSAGECQVKLMKV